MRFAGWLKFRRGIMDHLMDGRLSGKEYIALTALIIMADASTGCGKINGAVLHSCAPCFKNSEAAQRALKSLEDKGYIYRQVKLRSPIVYPYAIDKYIPTTGPHKDRQVSVAKARNSHRFEDIEYLQVAADTADGTAAGTAAEAADYYKNETKERSIKKETRNRLGQYASDALDVTPSCTSDSSQSVPRSAHSTRTDDALTTHRPSSALNILSRSLKPMPTPAPVPAAPAPAVPKVTAVKRATGIRWAGADSGYRDMTTGKPVLFEEMTRRIAPAGLEWRECEFYHKATGEKLDWGAAQNILANQ
jgi:hypothetical protein